MSDVDMSRFTVSEMVKDRTESIKDIAMCEKALALGITTYGAGYSVQLRLESNRNIVAIIDAELWRRDKKEFA